MLRSIGHDRFTKPVRGLRRNWMGLSINYRVLGDFMFRRTKLCTGLMLAFGGTAVMTANLALAQTTPPEGQGQRVEITGSRIATINVEGTSPVTVIGAQDIKMEGVRSVENLLNNLPQVFADQGGNISNGATGTATVNLRNLGADRTLVLVNGRRVPGGSPRPGGSPADLNQIPAPLIRRVEVLTGGASAVYGSDAVAGVVNFIMNDKFEGLQLELNHSFYNHQQGNPVASIVAARGFAVPGDKHADGKISDATMLLGSNFADNKGNATFYFGYKREDALKQSERDFSACALGSNAAGFICSGSSTSFPGRFFTDIGAGDFTVADAAGGVRPFAATDIFNFGPENYFQRPSDRYTAAAFAHYDISDKAQVYSEFGFHTDHTVAQIAPSGLFGFDASGPNAIRCENPLLSDAWKAVLFTAGAGCAPGDTANAFILRRNVEGGGRQDDIRHGSYRTVLGLKGDIGAWHYDAYAQLARVWYQGVYRNDFSITRASRAMDVITDPATGLPACRSAVDLTDPNCVPYDIWRLGGVTPAALNYLQTPGFQTGSTGQNIIGATASVDLGAYGLKSPLAANPVEMAFGFENRVESLKLETDSAFTTGDLFGQGGATIGVEGEYKVRDAFMEARVPLIEKRPFVHLLSVNGSYRNSQYDTKAGSTDSYGLGVDYAPVEMARLRGSYQRAVRAPNVHELFDLQSIGLYDNDEDPCAGPTPTATLAQCMNTGVTAAQYGTIIDNPAGQYNALFGGNPDLNVETSNSFTLGVVLTPMKNLSVTVDWFKIEVDDVISTIPPTTTLSQCLETGNPLFCSLITRDARGTLWATPDARIVATNANLAKWKTSGVDINASYDMRIGGMGGLGFTFIGTYLKEFKQEPTPGLGTYDCAGLYGPTCGTPLPKWRHKLRTTWSTPWNVDLAVTWRHIDAVLLDRTDPHPLLTGVVREVDRKLGARDYLDVAASWNVNKTFTLRAGINNLLDRDPPLSAQVGAGFGNGNTFPQVYDALGRRVFLNATAKF